MEQKTSTHDGLNELLSEIQSNAHALKEIEAELADLEQGVVHIDGDLRNVESSTEIDVNMGIGQIEEALKDLNKG